MRTLKILTFLAWLGLLSSASAFAEELEPVNLHLQATEVMQGHPSMTSPYSGLNSFSASAETKSSFTSTLFLGYKLWANSAIYVDPEVSAGEGLSLTKGVGGFPNGEVYRVDSASAKLNLSRLYVQQFFGLGGEQEIFESDKNQLAARQDIRRFTVVGGKFSLNDFLDDNTYSHDPRTQFLNWALMDNVAWDYAADTRGYTWGVFMELNQRVWAARFAFVVEPVEANSLQLDPHFWKAYAVNWEFEYRIKIESHPGKARFLTYVNRAHMGSYSETLANPAFNTDITLTREYRTKYGFGLNLEQELNSWIGTFLRAGWNNGTTETWNFTEVDRTLTLGLSIKGSPWKRESDTFGVAGIIDGLSADHANYLAAGGYGFLIGDGRLNYAPEQIIETYYSFQVMPAIWASADFQYVSHPAYNADRGPASVIAGRVHFEM